MNDHIDSNITPDTEARVAAAMHALAATHTPVEQSVDSATRGSRRWMLAVAASAVLVVGVGALLLASNRDTDGAADRLPQPDTTTAPTTPVDTESTLPAAPTVYSAAPLGDDVVPVVLPAPAQPVRGFELGATDWTNGIENSTTFVVMDDDQIVGALQAFDSPAPWNEIADGQEVIEIDGRSAVRLEGSDERGYFFEVAGGTRAILDTSPPSRALGIDSDIADMVRLVGDQPLNRFDDTERFVRLAVDTSRGLSVSYGTDDALQVVRIGLEPDADDATVDFISDAYQLFVRFSGAGQVSDVVRVSPVDLVVIIARDDDDLTAALAGLQLVPRGESGVDFATYAAFAGDEIVARGEPEWGRWQLTAGADTGGSEDCRLFQARVWDIEGTGRGYTECGPLGERNPARADGARVYCMVLDVEIVGAVVGITSAAPVREIGPDIDGLRTEIEDTSSSEFGENLTFRIVQDEPGANIRSTKVLIDGAEIDCNG